MPGVMIDDMGQTYLAEPDDDVEAVHTLGPLQAAAVTNGVACGLRTGQGTLDPGKR